MGIHQKIGACQYLSSWICAGTKSRAVFFYDWVELLQPSLRKRCLLPEPFVIERLFVYGTLAPGRPNEHMLADISGNWEPATVTGTLLQEGWGAAAGYPGIILDEHGDEVHGLVFSSEALSKHWARLDEFEGEGYERVVTAARLQDGKTVEAYIYRLSGERPS